MTNTTQNVTPSSNVRAWTYGPALFPSNTNPMPLEQFAGVLYPGMPMDRVKWAIAQNSLIFIKWSGDAETTKNSFGQTVLRFPNGMTINYDDAYDKLIASDFRIFCEVSDHHGVIERFSTSDEFYLWLTRYF